MAGSTSDRIASSLLSSITGDIPTMSGLACLEFGAGTGSFSRLLAASGARVTAIEPYHRPSDIEGVTWLDGLTDLAPTAHFDVIFLIEVIEHLPNPAEVLSALTNHLERQTGSLIITTPNASGLRARLQGTSWRESLNPTHLHLFTPQGLEALGRRCGLSRIERLQEPVDFGHSLPRRLMNRVLQHLGMDGSLRMKMSGRSDV